MTVDSLTLQDLVAEVVAQGRATGAPDLDAAQNGVNRLLYRFGLIGNQLDSWYVCRGSGEHLPEHTADLIIEGVALLINVVGPAKAPEVLRRRLKIAQK